MGDDFWISLRIDGPAVDGEHYHCIGEVIHMLSSSKFGKEYIKSVINSKNVFRLPTGKVYALDCLTEVVFPYSKGEAWLMLNELRETSLIHSVDKISKDE